MASINDLLEAGIVFWGVHEVVVVDGNGDNPYGNDHVLFQADDAEDFAGSLGWDWADREITHIYPIQSDTQYPWMRIEVE